MRCTTCGSALQLSIVSPAEPSTASCAHPMSPVACERSFCSSQATRALVRHGLAVTRP